MILVALFSFSQKIADHVSDSSDQSPLSLFLGLLEGILCSIIFYVVPAYREYFLALISYWVIVGKIDNITHLLGLLIFIFTFASIFSTIDLSFIQFAYYLTLFIIMKYCKKRISAKNHFKILCSFPLNFVLITFGGLILFKNIQVLLMTITSTIVVTILKLIYKEL